MSRDDPTEVTRQHVFKQKGLSNKEEQARIVVLAGKLAGDKYAIGNELTFGRGDKADVQIDDTLVSRVHVRIFQHENGSYLIEDLASRNGTQVNGMAVTRRVLTYGDRIQIEMPSPRIGLLHLVIPKELVQRVETGKTLRSLNENR